LPELDVLVETFVEAGAFGARLTGAGFGGCVVGLAPAREAPTCLAATLSGYEARTGRSATGFPVGAVDGADVTT
jgi:galactokinase